MLILGLNPDTEDDRLFLGVDKVIRVLSIQPGAKKARILVTSDDEKECKESVVVQGTELHFNIDGDDTCVRVNSIYPREVMFGITAPKSLVVDRNSFRKYREQRISKVLGLHKDDNGHNQ